MLSRSTVKELPTVCSAGSTTGKGVFKRLYTQSAKTLPLRLNRSYCGSLATSCLYRWPMKSRGYQLWMSDVHNSKGKTQDYKQSLILVHVARRKKQQLVRLDNYIRPLASVPKPHLAWKTLDYIMNGTTVEWDSRSWLCPYPSLRSVADYDMMLDRIHLMAEPPLPQLTSGMTNAESVQVARHCVPTPCLDSSSLIMAHLVCESANPDRTIACVFVAPPGNTKVGKRPAYASVVSAVHCGLFRILVQSRAGHERMRQVIAVPYSPQRLLTVSCVDFPVHELAPILRELVGRRLPSGDLLAIPRNSCCTDEA
ncbi:hypothetical protein BJ546DRAFT_421759 [Cryomyces antarcticus]